MLDSNNTMRYNECRTQQRKGETMSRLQVIIKILENKNNRFHINFLNVQRYSDLVSILETLNKVD